MSSSPLPVLLPLPDILICQIRTHRSTYATQIPLDPLQPAFYPTKPSLQAVILHNALQTSPEAPRSTIYHYLATWLTLQLSGNATRSNHNPKVSMLFVFGKRLVHIVIGTRWYTP